MLQFAQIFAIAVNRRVLQDTVGSLHNQCLRYAVREWDELRHGARCSFGVERRGHRRGVCNDER